MISDDTKGEAGNILEELRKQRDAAEQHRDRAHAAGNREDYLFWVAFHRELHLALGRMTSNTEGWDEHRYPQRLGKRAIG